MNAPTKADYHLAKTKEKTRNAIITYHYEALTRTFKSINDSQDFIQECFFELTRDFKNFNESTHTDEDVNDHFLGWAFKLALRNDMDQAKYDNLREAPDNYDEEHPNAGHNDHTIENIDTSYFRDQLTSRQRAILVLREAGYENKDIAIKLGVNDRTIKRELQEMRNLWIHIM